MKIRNIELTREEILSIRVNDEVELRVAIGINEEYILIDMKVENFSVIYTSQAEREIDRLINSDEKRRGKKK